MNRYHYYRNLAGEDRRDARQVFAEKGDAATGGDCRLTCRGLARVYPPYQFFRQLYLPESALEHGTLFAELDFPFLAKGGKRR